MSKRDTIFFVSDMHFGIPDRSSSLERELLFVKWLDEVSDKASDIYIMGDMFDFWFEWKHVVPKGYMQLFGKMAALADRGVRFHFFIGNHDMWMFSYFQTELGAQIYRKDAIVSLQNKTLYLSHGDGLGPGDYGYKCIKKLFRNRFAQWCYARLHPNFAVGLAMFFSRKSRYSNKVKNNANALRERKLTDNQIIFANKVLQKQKVDYFIFGHQHTPVFESINEKSTIINIGNWLSDYTYISMKDGEVKMNAFTE